ncbi:MAG TPA: ROK family transcriptional regulator [Candidatus Merdenecus merdavium]|nr:ROK family transcriptional regulator [Candidatus Merdenecus merdavium]
MIKKEKVSRPDIATALGLSGPTVLQIVGELLEEGVIKEEGEFKSTGGRKAKAVAVVLDKYYSVGLDITANHISLVLCDIKGSVLNHKRIHHPFVPTRAYYQENGKLVDDFIENLGVDQEQILGVGISVPGIVDRSSNTLVYSHMLGSEKVLCNDMAQFIQYPCMLVNDANAAALTECYGDDQSGTSIYLSLSNSVGGGIISLNTSEYRSRNYIDSIYLGENWRGAEFGHMTLIPNGKKCYCGKSGCFDAYCSALQLADQVGGKLTEFFKRLQEDDEKLIKSWDDYLMHLSTMVHNLRMTFDGDIIIGGYVGSFIEPYLPELRKRVFNLDPFKMKPSYIKACKYKVEASALGAALHYIHTFIESV